MNNSNKITVNRLAEGADLHLGTNGSFEQVPLVGVHLFPGNNINGVQQIPTEDAETIKAIVLEFSAKDGKKVAIVSIGALMEIFYNLGYLFTTAPYQNFAPSTAIVEDSLGQKKLTTLAVDVVLSDGVLSYFSDSSDKDRVITKFYELSLFFPDSDHLTFHLSKDKIRVEDCSNKPEPDIHYTFDVPVELPEPNDVTIIWFINNTFLFPSEY